MSEALLQMEPRCRPLSGKQERQWHYEASRWSRKPAVRHKAGYRMVRPAAVQESIAQRFERLTQQWRDSRDLYSSGVAQFMDPSYQQIIGLGAFAVPLIVKDLQTEVDHWFWALKAITGADPVPDEHLGDLEAMRDDWTKWAQQHFSL